MKLTNKTHITSAERLQLLGLFALAQNLESQLKQVVKLANDITGETDEKGEPIDYGHTADFLSSDSADLEAKVNGVLKRLALPVAEATSPPAAPASVHPDDLLVDDFDKAISYIADRVGGAHEDNWDESLKPTMDTVIRPSLKRLEVRYKLLSQIVSEIDNNNVGRFALSTSLDLVTPFKSEDSDDNTKLDGILEKLKGLREE